MKKKLGETLSEVLSPQERRKVYNSFDIVGDIAIIRLPKASSVNRQTIARAIMSTQRNVKTVMLQASPVSGDLRLRRLIYVAGENKTNTIHRESGCFFAVDISKCYFSPRLSYERMRIARLAKSGEIVVNMFAGVGSFSIIIAKYSNASKVFSIDLNPVAIQFMKQNIRFNRVYDKILPLHGDSREISVSRLKHVADRVLMPLPEKAIDYLPCAVSTLKNSGGWLHYYGFEHATKAEKPTKKAKMRVEEALEALGAHFKLPFVRVVRSTGPNWYQLVADVHII